MAITEVVVMSISSLGPGHIHYFLRKCTTFNSPSIILFLFDIILHKDDRANTRRFDISTREMLLGSLLLGVSHIFFSLKNNLLSFGAHV
jgi:hypothetical protein